MRMKDLKRGVAAAALAVGLMAGSAQAQNYIKLAAEADLKSDRKSTRLNSSH